MGAIAILLHFMFDQGELVSRIPSWDWEDASTWRQVYDACPNSLLSCVNTTAILGACPFWTDSQSNEYRGWSGKDV